jgi:hypothetical protein
MKSEYHKDINYNGSDRVEVVEWYGDWIENPNNIYGLGGLVRFYHRENGPAVIDTFNKSRISEYYYLNNKNHRLDGPAHIRYKILDGERVIIFEKYCLFGITVTKEQFYTQGFIDSFILENS